MEFRYHLIDHQVSELKISAEFLLSYILKEKKGKPMKSRAHSNTIQHRHYFLFLLLILIFVSIACISDDFDCWLNSDNCEPVLPPEQKAPGDPVLETYSGTGKLTMNLTMDGGCDAVSGGNYNNNSSLHNIPVVITDKGKATIDYDKTTRDKHLVATGSGTIDLNGKLKLNFELLYTLKGTIGGKTVERGSEKAQGMITAVWDPKTKQWAGMASGLVNSIYLPFGEGKGSSCSAGIIKGKLAPGFVDTDR